MWTCPKCGRSFRRTNQDHYCGEAPKTIEEYILRQREEVQPQLRQVDDAIRTGLPEAERRIAWGMPSYWKGQYLMHYAAFQRYISVYPMDDAAAALAEKMGVAVHKGAMHLPYDKPLPLELITEIARRYWEQAQGK